MKRTQSGYINIPSGVFETVGILALVGLLSVIGFICYAAYWLIVHVRFV